jgi:hypothetical protein
VGYSIQNKQKFAKSGQPVQDDERGLLRLNIVSALTQTGKQTAFALSLHYKYPQDHDDKDHGPTLDFSEPGGLGARRITGDQPRTRRT